MKPNRISPRLDKAYKNIRDGVENIQDSFPDKSAPAAQDAVLNYVGEQLKDKRKELEGEILTYFQTCELGLTVVDNQNHLAVQNFLRRRNIHFRSEQYVTFRFLASNGKQYYSNTVQNDYVSLGDIEKTITEGGEKFLPDIFTANPKLRHGARVTLALNERTYADKDGDEIIRTVKREKLNSPDRLPVKDTGYLLHTRDTLGNDTIGIKGIFRDPELLFNSLHQYMHEHKLDWSEIDIKGRTPANKEFPGEYDAKLWERSVRHAKKLNRIYLPEDAIAPVETKYQMMPGVFYVDHQYNRIFPLEAQFVPAIVEEFEQNGAIRHDKYKKIRKLEDKLDQVEKGVDLIFPEVVELVRDFYDFNPVIL